jgi:hypothetical protein
LSDSEKENPVRNVSNHFEYGAQIQPYTTCLRGFWNIFLRVLAASERCHPAQMVVLPGGGCWRRLPPRAIVVVAVANQADRYLVIDGFLTDNGAVQQGQDTVDALA